MSHLHRIFGRSDLNWILMIRHSCFHFVSLLWYFRGLISFCLFIPLFRNVNFVRTLCSSLISRMIMLKMPRSSKYSLLFCTINIVCAIQLTCHRLKSARWFDKSLIYQLESLCSPAAKTNPWQFSLIIPSRLSSKKDIFQSPSERVDSQNFVISTWTVGL